MKKIEEFKKAVIEKDEDWFSLLKRVPPEFSIEVVKKEEKIEESTDMRKLIRIGFETYVGNLYRQDKVTLREDARLLGINQLEAMNLFLDSRMKENLDAPDVLTSMERFIPRTSRRSNLRDSPQ